MAVIFLPSPLGYNLLSISRARPCRHHFLHDPVTCFSVKESAQPQPPHHPDDPLQHQTHQYEFEVSDEKNSFLRSFFGSRLSSFLPSLLAINSRSSQMRPFFAPTSLQAQLVAASSPRLPASACQRLPARPLPAPVAVSESK